MSNHPDTPPAPESCTAHNWSRIGRLAAGLTPGIRGEQVAELQTLLGVAPDGVYGPATEHALKASFVAATLAAARASQASTRVPAALTTAQAILESRYGRNVPTDSRSGEYSYNLFGIKETRPDRAVMCMTHEVVHGVSEPRICLFAAYRSFQESLDAHAAFLIDNHRYSHLFQSSDPREWANELHRLGYATDPYYGPKLISLMDLWKLT